jgi:hypothetical protein
VKTDPGMVHGLAAFVMAYGLVWKDWSNVASLLILHASRRLAIFCSATNALTADGAKISHPVMTKTMHMKE